MATALVDQRGKSFIGLLSAAKRRFPKQVYLSSDDIKILKRKVFEGRSASSLDAIEVKLGRILYLRRCPYCKEPMIQIKVYSREGGKYSNFKKPPKRLADEYICTSCKSHFRAIRIFPDFF